MSETKDVASAAAVIRALDRHIAALEADVDDTYAEYGLRPSPNQFFQYVSDDTGTIALQQDAAFACERIAVCYVEPGFASTDAARTPFDVNIRQTGPGRDITFSRARARNSNAVVESRRVPVAAFIPIPAPAQVRPEYPNSDYIYTLPVEWLIPRGDVVKTDFAPMADLGRINDFTRVVLLGYKIF
jgi:hypothetical protein